jgi:P pilus assembly chaperone PapD
MRARLLAFAAAVALAGGAPAVAQTPATAGAAASAFLNITPKRLTFDGKRRAGAVVLLNQGTEPVTVDIGLVDRVMLPDGQIFAVDDADRRDDGRTATAQLKSAKDLLQLSPRRATLQPGRPQTVRIRLASLPDAATGEHRSHLTVTTIPPPTAGLTAEQVASGQRGELSFQISTVFGISIPAIVRFSDADVRAQISNPHVEFDQVATAGKAPKRTPVMVFDLERVGGSSLFGNIEVKSLSQRGAQLGLARGVGVYAEISKRVVRIPLTREPAAGERLEITFTDDDTSPGKLLAKLDT